MFMTTTGLVIHCSIGPIFMSVLWCKNHNQTKYPFKNKTYHQTRFNLTSNFNLPELVRCACIKRCKLGFRSTHCYITLHLTRTWLALILYNKCNHAGTSEINLTEYRIAHSTQYDNNHKTFLITAWSEFIG